MREIGMVGVWKEEDRGWDDWMASPTQWTWVLVGSGRWWWTGRPGVLWFLGSQRVGHDWATELNWTQLGLGCLVQASPTEGPSRTCVTETLGKSLFFCWVWHPVQVPAWASWWPPGGMGVACPLRANGGVVASLGPGSPLRAKAPDLPSSGTACSLFRLEPAVSVSATCAWRGLRSTGEYHQARRSPRGSSS